MSAQNTVVANLTALVGPEAVVAPDAQNIARHISDYAVQGDAGVGILALTYPRSTDQVAGILRYCNEHRIAVQPQGGMTGLAGGAVPMVPCVIVSLERMRAIRELDSAAGTITVSTPGLYTFSLPLADDAASVSVGGATIIEQNYQNALGLTSPSTATVDLTGPESFTLFYYNLGGNADLFVQLA